MPCAGAILTALIAGVFPGPEGCPAVPFSFAKLLPPLANVPPPSPVTTTESEEEPETEPLVPFGVPGSFAAFMAGQTPLNCHACRGAITGCEFRWRKAVGDLVFDADCFVTYVNQEGLHLPMVAEQIVSFTEHRLCTPEVTAQLAPVVDLLMDLSEEHLPGDSVE